MVSNIPGTTRDAIDSRFTAPDGTEYNIIDTAGIRRKRVIEDESLERYSVLRSIAAIKRCDVALMLIDAPGWRYRAGHEDRRPGPRGRQGLRGCGKQMGRH